jgi:predicted alpha/beta-hydrolase family hydrolase
MRHPFLESVAKHLAERGIATFRYQFPYMEADRRRPDTRKVLETTTRAAMAVAARRAPDLPLVVGGKSLSGRISSYVAATDPLPALRGLIFLGYPLHAPGQPDTKRAEHLAHIAVPMLFLQGTRDSLADLELLVPIVEQLGEDATLRIIEGGDHSFNVLKRSGRTGAEAMAEIAAAISDWSDRITE